VFVAARLVAVPSPGGQWSIVNAHVGPDSDGSYNREILNGYLDTHGDTSVTLSQIGYSFYDVYVYFSSDVADRAGSVTDGTTTHYFKTLGSASIDDASGNAVLIQATNTTTAGYAEAANYAVFRGLSGDSRTLTTSVAPGGGIAAIQVVGLPDPLPSASLAIELDAGGASVTLSWPTGLGDVLLEESSDVQGWSPSSPQPTTNSIVVPVQTGSRLFRLTRP